jgi:hypothetical protein
VTIVPFLNKVNHYILNPIILLLFSIAFLVFFLGILKFINSEAGGKDRDKGKERIMYGLIGMFIMFSAYGLIHLIISTFGIHNESTYLGF